MGMLLTRYHADTRHQEGAEADQDSAPTAQAPPAPKTSRASK